MRYSANFVNFFFLTALLKRFPINVSQHTDYVYFSAGVVL